MYAAKTENNTLNKTHTETGKNEAKILKTRR